MDEDTQPPLVLQEDGPWVLKVTLWKDSDDPDRSRETTTDKVFSGEPTPLDAINALLYDIRGDKSPWELAYVDEVRHAG